MAIRPLGLSRCLNKAKPHRIISRFGKLPKKGSVVVLDSGVKFV